MQQPETNFNRRTFLRAGLVVSAPIALALVGCTALTDAKAAPTKSSTSRPAGSTSAPAQSGEGQVLEPTPECVDADDVTPAQTEGPYFTPNSPERTSLLEPGTAGTKLTVTGYVLSPSCQPVAGALVDFWQADAAGQYDNRGYTMRGHQYTDETGRYTLETVLPGLYPGRTRHIHVKVQAPSQRILTTQLYFPNEPGNARDGNYSPKLQMAVQDAADGRSATFNFVVNAV